MLKKHYIAFLLICIPFLVSGCFSKWTEKRKREFSEQCEQTKILDGITFFVTGFSFSGNDSILIRQMHDSSVVDSFYVPVSLHDSLRDRYYGSISNVAIDDVYYFIIPEEQTFVLSEMKMGMHPQFTMFSEGYGCRLKEYKIDGELVEGSSNPDFMKEGYVFVWDR